MTKSFRPDTRGTMLCGIAGQRSGKLRYWAVVGRGACLTPPRSRSTLFPPMNTLDDLSLDNLRRAVQLREEIDSLRTKLNQILGGGIPAPHPAKRKGRKKVSAAGRARMAAAQRARWASLAGKKVEAPTAKPKRKMSAAGRAAISAAAKARWRKAKAAGRTRL